MPMLHMQTHYDYYKDLVVQDKRTSLIKDKGNVIFHPLVQLQHSFLQFRVAQCQQQPELFRVFNANLVAKSSSSN